MTQHLIFTHRFSRATTAIMDCGPSFIQASERSLLEQDVSRGRQRWHRLLLEVLSFLLAVAAPLNAQPTAPRYDECRLDAIFPNGGQRGTTVKVNFHGLGHGLTGPKEIVIDGPNGIAVKDIKQVNINQTEATLEIAADAPLGRRWVRVATERSGLTNFAAFVVGSLPEQLEAEPNNDTAKAQAVTLPTVVNGHITPAADLDYIKFTGKTGQKVVAAIAAHALDVHGQYKDYGIADFSLELSDANGRTIASAEDTVGFDPIIETTLPADGDYFVRVQLLNFAGFPEAVYRLTLGDVPYAVAAFPAGYQRGTLPKCELFGPHVRSVPMSVSAERLVESEGKSDPGYPLRYITTAETNPSGLDVPLVVGELPEIVEAEPNDERAVAAELKWPITVNGRFQQPGDADWYRVKLEAGQKIQIETTAHRFIRSPIDTRILVYDATGKLVNENDDEAFEPGYEAYHDFKTTDSKLLVTAPAAGEFFIKVTEQTGTSGPRAIYRLSIDEARPDFRLTHFPDAVPVWGPGSTACVLVRVDRFFGCDDDIEISIEGLPTGWSSSAATSLGGKGIRPYNTHQLKVFLTVTAPPDATPGTCFPFRIIGRAISANEKAPSAGPSAAPSVAPAPQGTQSAKTNSANKTLERASIPLTLFYTSDTGFFRASPVSRVAVAKSQGPWLEAITREITIPAGGTATMPVKVLGVGDFKTMPIVVNIATAGVACVLTTPQNLPIQPSKESQSDEAIKTGLIEVPIKVAPDIYPGTYGITIAQTWSSDIRVGMPAPCTPLIKLTVTPKP